MFRNVSLKCLTEIAGVSVSQYEEQFVTLFTLTMMQLKQVMVFVKSDDFENLIDESWIWWFRSEQFRFRYKFVAFLIVFAF